jgi:hypothetical protein
MEGDGCWSMITTAKITVKNDAWWWWWEERVVVNTK